MTGHHQPAVPPTLIGDCPTITIDIYGVPTPFLLDTGSMVTTLSEAYYSQYIQPHAQTPLKNCDWLQLTAANGLAIPYCGYAELDLTVLGRCWPNMGVLITKDSLRSRRGQRNPPVGLLGMNVIRNCFHDLFLTYGQSLFSAPEVAQAERGWRHALAQCQRLANVEETGYVGRAVTPPGERQRIPADSLQWVTAHCNHVAALPYAYLEPVTSGDAGLPDHLLISPALLPVEGGLVRVPVVNVSREDQWLPARAFLGHLYLAHPQTSPAGTPTEAQVCGTEVQDAPASEIKQELQRLQWEGLSPEEQQAARRLLASYSDTFSTADGEVGCTSLVQHEIPLTNSNPVRQRYRRIPPAQFTQVKEHVHELLRKGIVRPSNSPYASPIVVVQKKTGEIRLCVDYRELNARTRRDAYPLPRIDESLDALSGARWFSTLDLASGYNQVPMAEHDKDKTAFCTPFGLFEFNRMPFGLCNAPGTFQRLMERIFGDQSLQSLLLYLDDIVIFSTTFSQHLQRLDMVLGRLRQHQLKLKLSKCCFFRTEVPYLGHIVSAAGVATDPEKVRAVAEWPPPRTLKDLRAFLGFASYYRRFVEGFAHLAAPLHRLVGECQGPRKAPAPRTVALGSRWSDACQQGFQQLKQRLTTAPVLAYADFRLPFVVEIDASYQGLGAVLSQDQEGRRRPIAFASRGLRKTERNMDNYSSMKLEFLALKWAVTEKFREYLLGHSFTVYTDNNPLSYIQTTAKLAAVEQRWASQLAQFNFSIKYRPGPSNRNADALSRLPRADQPAPSISPPPGPVGVQAVGVTALPTRTNQEIRRLQDDDPTLGALRRLWDRGHAPTDCERRDADPELKDLLGQWNKLEEHDGLLFRSVYLPPSRTSTLQLLLPTSLRPEVLGQLHDNHGHQGIERTTALVQARCYWPRMRPYIERWCKACQRCQVAKATRPTVKTTMGHLLASRPLEIIAIDFTSLDRSSDGYEHLLIVTDIFSKFTQAYPTRDQKAHTVVKTLTEKWFYTYGVPQQIHSDQGRSFEADLVKQLCKLYGVTKSRTTPYHPQGNGQCERFNRTLFDLLRTLPSDQKRRWPRMLPQLLFAYNTTTHHSTGFSPYELLFGRRPQLPVDALLGRTESEATVTDLDAWMTDHKRYLDGIYQAARRHLESAARDRQRQAPGPPDPPLPVGTVVLHRQHPLGRCKIQDRWEECRYHVTACPEPGGATYTIQPVDLAAPPRVVHRSEIRPLQDSPREPGPHTPATRDEEEPAQPPAMSPRSWAPPSPSPPPSPRLVTMPYYQLRPRPPTAPDPPAPPRPITPSPQRTVTPTSAPDSNPPSPLLIAPLPPSRGPTPPPAPGPPPQSPVAVPTAASPPAPLPPPPASPGPRRSQRTTFGQHPNPFNLPRPVVPPLLPPVLDQPSVAETATFQSRGECSRPDSAGSNCLLVSTLQFPLPPGWGGSDPPAVLWPLRAEEPRPPPHYKRPKMAALLTCLPTCGEEGALQWPLSA